MITLVTPNKPLRQHFKCGIMSFPLGTHRYALYIDMWTYMHDRYASTSPYAAHWNLEDNAYYLVNNKTKLIVAWRY
jgi:hypothetical protein